ncbi:hypothetical protein F443_17291, partial [Phytophthora nicotianae P1569]
GQLLVDFGIDADCYWLVGRVACYSVTSSSSNTRSSQYSSWAASIALPGATPSGQWAVVFISGGYTTSPHLPAQSKSIIVNSFLSSSHIKFDTRKSPCTKFFARRSSRIWFILGSKSCLAKPLS